jgi:hypothetical protein
MKEGSWNRASLSEETPLLETPKDVKDIYQERCKNVL